MAGPIAQVDTLLAGINLDIDRQLYWEDAVALTFEFIVPDRSQLDNWMVLKTLTEGFNRISGIEKTDSRDGSEVIFKVADLDGTIVSDSVLSQNDLHVRVDGQIYPVSRIPPVASNEAQVYTLTCKTRSKRANFDTTRK